MELNAPISIFQRQRYAEGSAMAPFRDDRNTPQAWKKNRVVSKQGNSSLDALQQLVSKLSRQRRPFRGGFVPQTFTYEAIQPFQFYGVSPSQPYAINNPGTGYLPLDVLTLVGGTLATGSTATTFTIPNDGATDLAGIVTSLQVVTQGNYTTPPAYPAAASGGSGTGLTVSAVSYSDEWRTCSMRQGAIGLRSRFYALNAANAVESYYFSSIQGMSNIAMDVGNYQHIFSVNGDFQQSFDQPAVETATGFFTPRMLGANATPILISGIEETQGDFVCWPQIVLNAPDSGQYQAAFWLEIVDSLTSKGKFVHPNLWGQMFDDNSNDAFPTSTSGTNNVNIIPLAIVSVSNNVQFIEQFLAGNLVNLFDSYFNNTVQDISPPITGGLAIGSKMCFRGKWTDDNLSGQYFYPGDIVMDDPPGASPLTVAAYISTAYFTSVTAPHSDYPRWLPMAY